MKAEQLKAQYDQYAAEYSKLQKEVTEFVTGVLNGGASHLHVADIRQRPNNTIKSWESIEGNIINPKKYRGLKALLEIKDIAAVRVICHCEDDLEGVATILEGNLKQKYKNVEKESKGGSGNTGKSRPSYRAVHLTFSKSVRNADGTTGNLFCEIQLRTVMADAWAVQDRKYIYGKTIEGEANYLTDAVADIMNGCDQLWSLVKKKSLEHDGVEAPEEILSLKKDTEDKVKALVQPPKSPLSVTLSHYWLDEKHDEAFEGFKKLSKKGYMEVRAQILDQSIDPNLTSIRKAAKDSTVHTFGWPIAVFLENREEFRPKPDGDSIKAEIAIKEKDPFGGLRERSTYDFWTIHKKGDFYLLASLFEDERVPEALFFNTRIIRITETLMYLRSLYSTLGVASDTRLSIEITHGGLKDRILNSSSPARSLNWPRKCGVDLVRTPIETNLNELNDGIADLVEKFSKPLFEQFDFFELNRSVLDDLVLNYVAGKIV